MEPGMAPEGQQPPEENVRQRGNDMTDTDLDVGVI